MRTLSVSGLGSVLFEIDVNDPFTYRKAKA